MDAAHPVERLSGSRTVPVTWAELDSDYTLKLPALFHPCLDALTAVITGAFDLFGMGRRGIAPITHYLEIAAGADPLALGRPLELRYTVELFRAQLPPGRSGAARERLLLDQRIALHGFRRAGSATDLGFDDGSGAPVQAGTFRLIQVFTRPFAAAEQRQVTEVPEEFRGLRERPFPGPPPSLERLWAAEPGLREAVPPEVLTLGRVWGRGHTDVNHHVTVAEYLRLLEAALVAGVDAAALPVAAHRTARLCCLFRRPFYAGERCAVQGRLLLGAGTTRLLGGIHKRLPDGSLEAEPSVGARLEGVLQAVQRGE
jgi:hypothetical protein